MALQQDIKASDEVWRGEDKTLEFTVYVPGTTLRQVQDGTATAQDITGWTLEWVLAHGGGLAPTLRKRTGGEGITIVDGPAGRCDVTLAEADTEAIPPGTYFHTLWRDDPGQRSVLSYGDFVLKDPVPEQP